MALLPGQVSVRGLVMGCGTGYAVTDQFNPLGVTARVEQTGSRAWGHGSWSGVEWAEERAVPIRVYIRDDANRTPAAALAAYQRLAAAFRPVGDTVEPVELRWYEDRDREYVRYGRTRMVEPDRTQLRRGAMNVDAAFVALDPLIYAGVETVAGPFALPEFTGGLTVPFTVPFTIGTTQVGGGADLVNEGTADTGLSLRIDGPVNQPRIFLKPAGGGSAKSLFVDISLAAGQYLEIDTAARSVLLNGVTSWRGQTSGELFLLSAGTHRLEFRGDGTGTLTSTHRSAWW